MNLPSAFVGLCDVARNVINYGFSCKFFFFLPDTLNIRVQHRFHCNVTEEESNCPRWQNRVDRCQNSMRSCELASASVLYVRWSL